MKKCRRCAKSATLHITEIHDGKAVAVHLCNSCAQEYLDEEADQVSSGPPEEVTAKLEALMSDEADADTRCTNCNISFGEFREQGRLGCPTCFDEFRDDLTPLLENIHESAQHVGKRPRRSPSQTVDQARLMQIRQRLKDAIELEDYELAASLRDEIQEIEQTLFPASGAESDTPPAD